MLREAGVVIVTGAAGGLGGATARHFAERGYRVVGLDINPMVQRLGASHPDLALQGLTVDHTDLTAVEDAFQVAAGIGPVTHLLAFAGGPVVQEIAHDDEEEGIIHPRIFTASLDKNLIGHVNVLWAAQKLLFQGSGDRSVTLVSSINARQSWGKPAYSSAKAGLVGLVHALAGPYGRRGVRLNALEPGSFDTVGARAEYPGDEARFRRLEATVPLGRLGAPDDLAATAFALACELRHVHGAILSVDGGQSADRTPAVASGTANRTARPGMKHGRDVADLSA